MSKEKDHSEHEPTIEELIMCQESRKLATPIAEFHQELISRGMSEESARQMTGLYTRSLFFGNQSLL